MYEGKYVEKILLPLAIVDFRLRQKFVLGKKTKSITTTRKSMLKLNVKFQSLVAKCRKYGKYSL
jgi:hypothetical protein